MKDFLTMVAAFVVANLLTDWIRTHVAIKSGTQVSGNTKSIEDCNSLEEVEKLYEGDN
jgi:hypothetical protein